MKIDCISDLHSFKPELPGGDLLIVAGDLTGGDTKKQHSDVRDYLFQQNYKKKIIIAGNHDSFLVVNPGFYSETDMTYLCNSSVEYEGLKIYGSPHTPFLKGVNPRCAAFMLNEEKIKKKWDMIPKDTDILVTHGPPQGILDKVESFFNPKISEHVGCPHLLSRFADLNLRAHIFGHIHEGYGIKDFRDDKYQPIIYANCAHVDERYKPVNKAIRIEL